MSSIRLSGSTSGHYDLTVPAVAGTNSIDLSKLPVLAANNKLGIGTTSPTSDLHIQRTGSNASITIEETSATNYSQYVELKDSTTSWYMANRYAITGANNSGFGIGTTSSGDMLQIDTSGRVTTPSQVGFSVYTTASTAMSNTIQFGGTDFNTGNHFNTSNGIFTAPVAGKYYFHFHLLQSRTTSTGEGYVDFYKNGSYHYRNYEFKDGTINQHVEYKGGMFASLAANDTIFLYLQASVGSLSIISNFHHCKFGGYLLG